MIIESKKILNVPPQSIKFFAHISHDRYVAIVGK